MGMEEKSKPQNEILKSRSDLLRPSTTYSHPSFQTDLLVYSCTNSPGHLSFKNITSTYVPYTVLSMVLPSGQPAFAFLDGLHLASLQNRAQDEAHPQSPP